MYAKTKCIINFSIESKKKVTNKRKKPSTPSTNTPSKRPRKGTSPAIDPPSPKSEVKVEPKVEPTKIEPKPEIKKEEEEPDTTVVLGTDPDDYPVQLDHQEFIPVSEFSPDYVNLLQKVQDRISNPREDDNLEVIVELIQKTGCFALDNDSFQFDLCLLDKRTVKKITKHLGINYQTVK